MDADVSLEDGEIIDCDEEDSYTPLERPTSYSSTIPLVRFPTTQEVESEEEVESSSETDSDSDSKAIKRPKLKLKPRVACTKNATRKKYDIWSTHAQEDVLLQNLVNCDVSQVDRSRSVETYPLPNQLAQFTRRNNKRAYSDRGNSNLRLTKRHDAEDNSNLTSVPRTILDVHVTVDNSEEEIAKDIANKLYEEKEDLILTIVNTAGKQKALELFKATQKIEEGGGMLIMNQTRRRTPGGVFLFLVKHDNNITREQQIKIFDKERVKYKQEVRSKRKLKLKKLKQKIAAGTRNPEQSVPELLTRAELCVQELTEDKERAQRESEDIDVKNPPPSPVTDCHENSMDELENINKDTDTVSENINNYFSRKLISYEDDCLDVATDDMDLF